MEVFAERLREALKTSGLSQSQLARKIHLSQDSVSAYCTGKHKPPIDVLVLICKTLDESADYLLGLTD